ncbi:MAG: hypothetical protein WA045_00470 [Nitrospira sp.]
MIQLASGEWCYSPALPLVYTLHGGGPGDWVKGDLAKWNLIWLTYAEHLEPLREGRCTMGFFVDKVKPDDFGVVAACARPEMSSVFPGLREALTQPLPLFLHVFKNGPAAELPAEVVIPDWSNRVLQRATEIWKERCQLDDQVPLISEVEVKVVDNVFHVNFGGRKSG